MLAFSLVGVLHPIALVHLAMVAAWVIVLFTGIGLYFSARLRRTTSAVIATMAVPIVLWLVVPAMLALADSISGRDSHLNQVYACFNPLVQAGTVAAGATEGHSLKPMYDWPDGKLGMGPTTWMLLGCALAFSGVGVLAAWHAKRLLRRTVY